MGRRPGHTLTGAEVSAIRLAARRVREAGPLDSATGIAAVDALVDVVGTLCERHRAEARDEAVSGMLAAVDHAFATTARRRARQHDREWDSEAS